MENILSLMISRNLPELQSIRLDFVYCFAFSPSKYLLFSPQIIFLLRGNAL